MVIGLFNNVDAGEGSNHAVLLLQVVKTNQFSVTRHEKVANGLIGDQGLPGVFVLYELSPMMVKFTEKQRCILISLHTHVV